MSTLLPTANSSSCPDCPRVGFDCFDRLARRPAGCALDGKRLEAKAPIPPGWSEHYAFYMVRRGVLLRQRIDAHGRSVILDAAGPGCVFALEPDEPTAASTSCGYAATDVLVCLLERSELERSLEEEPLLASELLTLERRTLIRVERLAQARGAETAAQRVAALLLTLTDTLTPGRRRSHLPPGLTQRTLAQMIGVRHETLCRALRKLDSAGAIERSADGLRIMDRAGLLDV